MPLAGDYDLVLIDCPPGNEPLQAAAAAAARGRSYRSRPITPAAKGLLDDARRLDDVMDVNPDLDLLGVVLVGVGPAHTRSNRPQRS